MSRAGRKTKVTKTKRPPVTLTRDEIDRAGESIVAASEALGRAIQSNITAIGILAAARDRADQAGNA